MSDEDFFGAASNGDVFGSEPGQQDNAQNGTEQKQNGDSFGFGDDAGFGFGDDADDVFGAAPGSKSEVTTEHKEAPNTRNEATDPQTQGNGAFDGDFAVNFGGDEAPIPQVHDDGIAAIGGGFDSTNWNTSFGDDDAFAGHIEEKPQQNGINADDDQLFAAADDVGDIWGSPDDVPAATTGKKEEEKHGLFDDNFGDDFGSGDVVFADDNGAEMKQNVVSPDPPNMDDPMFGGNDPEFPNFGASISEINGASDVDAGGDGLFDDDFDDDDAAVEFPEFDVSAATKPQRVEAVGDAVPSAVSPSPNEITSIPEPVIKFEASPLPNMSAVPESTSNNITDEVDADNPFGVDPFGASGSSGDDHLEDDDDIDADNPFAMFDEPDQVSSARNALLPLSHGRCQLVEFRTAAMWKMKMLMGELMMTLTHFHDLQPVQCAVLSLCLDICSVSAQSHHIIICLSSEHMLSVYFCDSLLLRVFIESQVDRERMIDLLI